MFPRIVKLLQDQAAEMGRATLKLQEMVNGNGKVADLTQKVKDMVKQLRNFFGKFGANPYTKGKNTLFGDPQADLLPGNTRGDILKKFLRDWMLNFAFAYDKPKEFLGRLWRFRTP